MGVDITRRNDTAVVAFKAPSISEAEQLDTASAQIKQFVGDNNPEALVFDFAGVKFLSSRVLNLLLDIRAGLQANNGELFISGINPQLYRIFKITNLDKVFRFFPDAESAFKAIGKN